MEEGKNKRIIIVSVLLGFLAAFPFMAAAGFVYLRYGHPPVATADSPFPYEKTIVHIPLDARIDRQLTARVAVSTLDAKTPKHRP